MRHLLPNSSGVLLAQLTFRTAHNSNLPSRTIRDSRLELWIAQTYANNSEHLSTRAVSAHEPALQRATRPHRQIVTIDAAHSEQDLEARLRSLWLDSRLKPATSEY